MADGLFRHLVKQAGLSEKIEVDSAGTGNWHTGEAPHPGTQKVLRLHGIDYNGRARQFSRTDLNRYDYVLAMDTTNLADIHRMARWSDKAEIRMFLSYANDAGSTDVTDVPDPYYSGSFDPVYDLIEKGCLALLDHIRQENHL
jgi:protein-tyrosine phosphatase